MKPAINYDLGHRRLLNEDGVVVLVYHERLSVPGSPLLKAREAIAQALASGLVSATALAGGLLIQCLLTDQAGQFEWRDFVLVSAG